MMQATKWTLPRVRLLQHGQSHPWYQKLNTNRRRIELRSFNILSGHNSLQRHDKENNHKHYLLPLHHQHCRSISWLPEAVQNASIWGGSGFLLKTIHAEGAVPYWACFATISVLVRLSLIPLVVYGAQTSSRFAKVVPEVQFLLTLFQNDLKKLRERNASLLERWLLLRTNLGTLGGIYKLNNIHPFAVFLSPLVQLPIFMYISVDLRKIVNGLDPLLAQQLVDSPVAWVPDLTEPDPWFALPVLAGAMLYAQVEVSIGKQSLSGPSAGQSDTGLFLKDIFQSVAVFMPCFTSQLPAGVQIYVVTSFLFTAAQSTLLRTESVRSLIGLPSLLAPPPSAVYAEQFMELKKLEQKAVQERERNGTQLVGKGVLAGEWTVSFAGTHRPSTIAGSSIDQRPLEAFRVYTAPKDQRPLNPQFRMEGPFIAGVSAPYSQIVEQQHQMLQQEQEAQLAAKHDQKREFMPQFSDEVIEKANRGEVPREVQILKSDVPSTPTRPTSLSLAKGRGRLGSSRKKKGKR